MFFERDGKELYCLIACQISKVHALSHEITFTSSNYQNTDKKTNQDVEMNNSDVEKIKESS